MENEVKIMKFFDHGPEQRRTYLRVLILYPFAIMLVGIAVMIKSWLNPDWSDPEGAWLGFRLGVFALIAGVIIFAVNFTSLKEQWAMEDAKKSKAMLESKTTS